MSGRFPRLFRGVTPYRHDGESLSCFRNDLHIPATRWIRDALKESPDRCDACAIRRTTETFYDSPALVRQRYLAGADAKGSYVASRLIGLGCSIRCSRAGFAHRPRFSPLLFSAKPERNAFKTVGFRHVRFTSRIIPIFIRLGRLLRGRPACSLLM